MYSFAFDIVSVSLEFLFSWLFVLVSLFCYRGFSQVSVYLSIAFFSHLREALKCCRKLSLVRSCSLMVFTVE